MIAAFAGCVEDRFEWDLVYDRECLAPLAATFEASILRGGCGSTDVVWRETIARGDRAALPPELPAGRYGFAGRAADASGRWFAEGCTEGAIPHDGALRVVLTSAEPCPPDAGPGADAGPTRDGGPGLDGSDTLRDGGRMDAASPPADAAAPRPPCPPPLGDARLSTVLSSSFDEDDPTVTADLLEIYFDSDRPGGAGMADLWVATRASPADEWSPPFAASELNGPARETRPEIAPDGLTLWFSSDRDPSAGGTDIWMSTRTDRSARWSTPVRVVELASTGNDSCSPPALSLTLMVITRPTPTNDLFVTTRPAPGATWAAPVALAELNTTMDESSAYVSPDGLLVLFGSNRAGGLDDIFCTERERTEDPFGPPVRIAELATGESDRDPWISADGSYLVFARGTGTDFDLWEVRR